MKDKNTASSGKKKKKTNKTLRLCLPSLISVAEAGGGSGGIPLSDLKLVWD